MENKKLVGHLGALLTIIIWGTTFISTCGNSGFPLCYGIFCVVYCLSSPIEEHKPQTGADLCCSWAMWDMPVLSFGEYCPYPHNGF